MGAKQMIATNPLLDKRLINAFIDGVSKTMTTMANTKCEIGKPFVEKKFESKGDVAGLISMMAGTMKGVMTISYEKEVACQIVQNMLNEEHVEVNDQIIDAIGELTNMVYGTAKTTLNELGYNFEMAIPTVVVGNLKITSYHSGATLVIPFSSNGGNFFVEITVQ
jgi:chemotaxis protein CheX